MSAFKTFSNFVTGLVKVLQHLMANQERCSAIFDNFTLKIQQFYLKLAKEKVSTWHAWGAVEAVSAER